MGGRFIVVPLVRAGSDSRLFDTMRDRAVELLSSRCHLFPERLRDVQFALWRSGCSGPSSWWGPMEPRSRCRATRCAGLLAALALEAGRTVSTQRLIDTLWGEQEVSGANVVQVLVSKLRRAVAAAGEPDLVATTPAGYQLVAGAASTDLTEFESLVEHAHRSQDDPNVSAPLLERAVGLWRGGPLGGAPDTEVFAGVRIRLIEMRTTAVDDLTDARLALGRHHLIAAELEQLVAEEPLRERRWAQLMRALYGSGRQADAMRAFQRARDVLIEQIGAEPGPELRRLEAAVLAHDDAVLLPTAGNGPAPIGHDFRRHGNLRHPVSACIGRDAEIDQVVALLTDHRLVTLLGPGGVGKTRLAQEIGVRVADDMPDGVWWVDAISARTETDLVGAVQRSLGIEGGPDHRRGGRAGSDRDRPRRAAAPSWSSTTASTSSTPPGGSSTTCSADAARCAWSPPVASGSTSTPSGWSR